MVKAESVYDARYAQGTYRARKTGYEAARAVALRHFIDRVTQDKRPARVLDYGAGSGLYVDVWQECFADAKLWFTDISPVALERLCARFPHHADHTVSMDSSQVSLPDRHVDAVVSVEVLEHVESLEDYLADIHRVLRPGGLFIFTTPCGNRMSIEYVYSRLAGQVDATEEGYRRWRWEDPTHLRRMRSHELDEALQRVGFDPATFRFRSHFFSFVCSYTPIRRVPRLAEGLMTLDYAWFRRFPNGASMLGCARKGR